MHACTHLLHYLSLKALPVGVPRLQALPLDGPTLQLPSPPAAVPFLTGFSPGLYRPTTNTLPLLLPHCSHLALRGLREKPGPTLTSAKAFASRSALSARALSSSARRLSPSAYSSTQTKPQKGTSAQLHMLMPHGVDQGAKMAMVPGALLPA